MTKYISVYFNATNQPNTDYENSEAVSFATLLNHFTTLSSHHFSICVEGCGIGSDENFYEWCRRNAFAFRMEEQVQDTADQIKAMIEKSTDFFVITGYGFSRGGVALFRLAQLLKDVPAHRLIINIAAFDPVPGNFTTTVSGDMLLGTHCTLSAAAADLTDCHNIGNVLILFASQAPHALCHAPILPALPPPSARRHIEVDVTPGSHRDSFNKNNGKIEPPDSERMILFYRIIEFMVNNGTRFHFDYATADQHLLFDTRSTEVLNLYNTLATKYSYVVERDMHLSNSIFSTIDKQYLNRYHQELNNVKIDDQNCTLSMKHHTTQLVTPLSARKTAILGSLFALAMAGMVYRYFNAPTIEPSHSLRPR